MVRSILPINTIIEYPSTYGVKQMDTMDIQRPNQKSEVLDILLADHRKLSMKRKMGVRREEYLDYMTFVTRKRALYCETLGPMVGLKEEWKSQGAADDELNLSAFEYREPLKYDCGIFIGYYGPDKSEVISMNDDEIYYRNYMGILHHAIRSSSSLGLPMEWPVKSREDWERIKPYYLFRPERIAPDLAARSASMREKGYVIVATMPGGFDEIRILLGAEEAIVLPYTDPKLLKEILDTIGDTARLVLDLATKETVIDELIVHEDMAGKNCPLWGPMQVREFMVPYYRKCWDIVKKRGGRLFNVDSDGDCNAILEPLVEGGINMFHPCEPEAGMDIVALRKKFGTKLAFEGGINKFALLGTVDDIDRELERVVPAMVKTGGTILSIDHRIPNGVSIANYRHYIGSLRKLIAKEEG
jgi:uroporphyrinogen-III decarboxylase